MQSPRTLPLIAIFLGAGFALHSLYGIVICAITGSGSAPVVTFAIGSLVAVVGLWALRREDY